MSNWARNWEEFLGSLKYAPTNRLYNFLSPCKEDVMTCGLVVLWSCGLLWNLDIARVRAF
jgi:hypothetical protein